MEIVFNDFSHDLAHVLYFRGALAQGMLLLSRVLKLAIRELTVTVS